MCCDIFKERCPVVYRDWICSYYISHFCGYLLPASFSPTLWSWDKMFIPHIFRNIKWAYFIGRAQGKYFNLERNYASRVLTRPEHAKIIPYFPITHIHSLLPIFCVNYCCETLCEHKNRAIGPNEVSNMDSFDTKRKEMFSIHIVRKTLNRPKKNNTNHTVPRYWISWLHIGQDLNVL